MKHDWHNWLSRLFGKRTAPARKFTTEELEELAETHIGRGCGSIISSSKSLYLEKNPGHLVLFNANVFVGRTKVWYGDIDVDRDSDGLSRLARETGETVSVFREAARWTAVDELDFRTAVVEFKHLQRGGRAV